MTLTTTCMGRPPNRVPQLDQLSDWAIDFGNFRKRFEKYFSVLSSVSESFQDGEFGELVLGRCLSEGSSGRPSGGTGSATEGSVVDEHEFVTRRTLSGVASCRAVTAPQAAAVGVPSQLGRRPRRTGSVT